MHGWWVHVMRFMSINHNSRIRIFYVNLVAKLKNWFEHASTPCLKPSSFLDYFKDKCAYFLYLLFVIVNEKKVKVLKSTRVTSFLNFFNRVMPNGLVSKLACWMVISMYTTSISPACTCSQDVMVMDFNVFFLTWNIGLLTNLITLWLSHVVFIGLLFKRCTFKSRIWIQIIYFVTFVKERHSASTLNNDIVGCHLLNQIISDISWRIPNSLKDLNVSPK